LAATFSASAPMRIRMASDSAPFCASISSIDFWRLAISVSRIV
jgi:hypothetical protein